MYKETLWWIIAKAFESDQNSSIFTLTLLVFLNETSY